MRAAPTCSRSGVLTRRKGRRTLRPDRTRPPPRPPQEESRMRLRRRTTLVLASLGLVGFLAPEARAQGYPNRPIRLVLGFAAGGPTDVIARVIAQDMTTSLGQPVVVENRTGANALVATEAVARA